MESLPHACERPLRPDADRTSNHATVPILLGPIGYEGANRLEDEGKRWDASPIRNLSSRSVLERPRSSGFQAVLAADYEDELGERPPSPT